MPVNIVLGLQWGDEGKGKIVDFLAKEHELIIRYQGGPNAGHTIIVDNDKYIFHHIPSGILHENKQCLISNGAIIDLITLKEEIESLLKKGIDPKNKLFISSRAHLILPFHKLIDQQGESRKNETGKIGTTGRGIGPTYSSKYERSGLRFCDLFSSSLKEKIQALANQFNPILTDIYQTEPIDPVKLTNSLTELREYFRDYMIDSYPFIRQSLKEDKKILLEGAQGAMLDIDFGTYPYVTSSHCLSGGAVIGTGIPPKKISRLIGILKVYTTRVGNGPFPTELTDATGEKLRQAGAEFGSTTGRPRRCGWLDLVLAKYTVDINGITEIALTKTDILDSFEEIKVCTAYRLNGETIDYFPADIDEVNQLEPVYETLPGWESSTENISSSEEIPENCLKYIEFIEKYLHVPVRYLSIGPRRKQLIIR